MMPFLSTSIVPSVVSIVSPPKKVEYSILASLTLIFVMNKSKLSWNVMSALDMVLFHTGPFFSFWNASSVTGKSGELVIP